MFVYDKEFIAFKIKLARKRAGYTQEQLAEKINITAKQLSRIEQANYIPSLPTFLKIIRILNININDFGIYEKIPLNSNKEKFYKLINLLNDNELEFYYKLIKSISENSELIQK